MKKYSFIVLCFIVLQAAAQNITVLKGSFTAAKEKEGCVWRVPKQVRGHAQQLDRPARQTRW